jgi:U3 small nucleolar RNA-associated protein 10
VLLTRTVQLADEPFLAILEALLAPDSGANSSQRLLTLLVILNDRKGWTSGLGENAAEHLSYIPRLSDLLIVVMGKYDLEDAIAIVVSALAER